MSFFVVTIMDGNGLQSPSAFLILVSTKSSSEETRKYEKNIFTGGDRRCGSTREMIFLAWVLGCCFFFHETNDRY